MSRSSKVVKNQTRLVKWIYCRYCGAKLRRDPVGQYCKTKNCQWEYGLPRTEDTYRKV